MHTYEGSSLQFTTESVVIQGSRLSLFIFEFAIETIRDIVPSSCPNSDIDIFPDWKSSDLEYAEYFLLPQKHPDKFCCLTITSHLMLVSRLTCS